MTFNKLSIVQRVKVIQISTIVVLIVLNFILWFQQQQSKELHSIELSISDIRIGMLQLRRHEKDFIMRLNSKYEQLHKQQYTSIESTIHYLEKKLIEQNILSSQFLTIPKYLYQYRENFSLLVNSYQRFGINDESGEKLVSESLWNSLINQDEITLEQTNKLLRLQLLKKKFLIKRSTENASLFTRYADNLSKEGFFSKNFQFHLYMTEFSNLVRLKQEIGFTHEEGREGKVRSSFHQLEDELDQLLAHIRPSIVQLEERTTIFVMVLTLLIASFTTFLLYSVGNSIIYPISLIVKNIDSLRKGKRDIEFPDSQDELDHIYTALINFQDDLISLDSLREKEDVYHHNLKEEKVKLESALAEINQIQTQLIQSEKLASLGSLVAGVAHEINTPLGIAVTVGSTLEQNANIFINKLKSGDVRRSDLGNFEAEELEGWEVLQNALKRAATLIHHFKQVAIDQTTEDRREFNLLEVVDENIMTISHQIKNSDISYQIKIDPNCEMNSYPGPLGQVITNLFNNAVKHGLDGCSEGNILISGKIENKNIVLTIKDDGLGIPKDIIANIFDPFFTTKLGQGGSGLGLNITYNIVNSLLGGSIKVESEEGNGTCFIIDIPINSPMKE